MSFTNRILVGDCREVMAGLPEGSVDLVVTSPPYWALRDYGTEPQIWGGDPECEHVWIKTQDTAEGYKGKTRWQHGGVHRDEKPEAWGTDIRTYSTCGCCGAWRGSLGLEPHPQLYIDHLVEVCRGIRRVLKPTGSLWLNLGDSYCNIGKWVNTSSFSPDKNDRSREGGSLTGYNVKGKLRGDGGWLQPKQLLGIPWRVAAALQNDGWVLRNSVVWHKPNAMPSSVKDRLKNSYEFIFFFVKQRRYYFDLDAVRVPHKGKPSGNKERKPGHQPNDRSHVGRSIPWAPAELTKHDQAVGRIGNYSYTDSLHLKAYSPDGKNPGDLWSIPTQPFKGAHFAVFPESLVEPIIKAASPSGGVVLDPFAGSGTTLRVARRLGRSWVGIEINPEYAEMCLARVKADDYQETPENVKPLSSFTK